VRSSIIAATVVFGLLVAAVVFALGRVLMRLEPPAALGLAAALGCAQAAAGLAYVRMRLRTGARPPGPPVRPQAEPSPGGQGRETED
jgi:hypothetical protein